MIEGYKINSRTGFVGIDGTEYSNAKTYSAYVKGLEPNIENENYLLRVVFEHKSLSTKVSAINKLMSYAFLEFDPHIPACVRVAIDASIDDKQIPTLKNFVKNIILKQLNFEV